MKNGWEKLILWLAGALLVFATGVAALAMIGITNSGGAVESWLLPVWIAAIGLLIFALVWQATPLGDKGLAVISLAASLIGAVAATVVAFKLRELFPSEIDAYGNQRGLTDWRICYRHLSLALAGVLIALPALYRTVGAAAAKRRAANAGVRRDKNGNPVYSGDSTIGLSQFGGEAGMTDIDESDEPLKRSRRVALRKAREQADAAREREARQNPDDPQ